MKMMKILGTILVVFGYLVGVATVGLPLVGLANAWIASDIARWWGNSQGIMIPGLVTVGVLFLAGYGLQSLAAHRRGSAGDS